MMIPRIIRWAVAALLLPATAAWAVQVNDRVENFRLFDHLGGSHELYYYNDASAVAVLVQANACEASSEAAERLAAIKADLEGRGVKFLMLNSSLGEERTAVSAAVGDEIPVLMDDTQIIGESLGAPGPGGAG